MIFQTKFPARDHTAEITFFGILEKDTMESIKKCTMDALRSNDSPAPAAAVWKSTPPNVWYASPPAPSQSALRCVYTRRQGAPLRWRVAVP